MTTQIVEVPRTAARPHRGVAARLLRNPLAVVSAALLLIVVVVTVFAPLIAPYDPNEVVAGLARSAPNAHHLMGGDGAGRDVMSRLFYGGRSTLVGALVSLAVAVLLGVPSGLVAGYFGGWFDGASGWVANTLLAIPSLVLLMALIAAIGPETVPVMAMFGVLLSPGFFRLTRTAVRNVRGELYIDAARVSGLSDARILRRHVTSVVRSPIIIQASISVGIATLMQTGLQFLGLGDTTVPSWGQMLSDAFTNIYAAPTLVIWPGATIGLTVAALALLGSSLSDALVDRPATRRAGRRRAAETARAVAAVVSGVDGSDRSPAAGRRRPAEPGAPGGDELLRVSGLSVSYPQPSGEDRRVLHDIELTVSRGEVLGLIGESGSGKTQTAFAVLGLLPAAATVSGGSIVFDGIALAGDPRAVARLRGRRIAYIPQEPMSNLDPAFTVGSQLVEPMRVVLGLSRAAARTRAMDLLERVGIAQPRRVFASYPHQISGGMAQRVLIAGAVSGNPDLLIADEPTTALDVTVQAEVLDLLRELQQERRMAMLMVTHNFGVVADICDRVAVMQDGRIVEQDEVRAIFTRASHPYTRSLVEAGMDNATARPPLSTAATVPAREGGAR